MDISYDALYVVLSVVLAVLASYTALELASRVSRAQDLTTHVLWLGGAALSLAMGIGSMHIAGVLAMDLPFELKLMVGPVLTATGFALVASAAAFSLMASGRPVAVRVAGGGLLLGLAMSGMHYKVMAAMPVTPAMTHDHVWVLLSVAAAIFAATGAVWVTTLVNKSTRPSTMRTIAAAVLGVALVSMHYLGMHAVHFALGTIASPELDGLGREALAASVAITSAVAILAALLLSHISSKLARQEHESSRLHRLNRELAIKAHTDSLTGLPNREALELHSNSTVALAQEQEKSFWVLFLDLDGFKAVNDLHGHQVGDELLKQVASRLVAAGRHDDKAFRVSGDEFVVVTSVSQADEQVGVSLAERILGAIREPYILSDAKAQVTASIGLARYPNHGDDVRSLLLAADTSMYAAKKSGKNRISGGRDTFAIAKAKPDLVVALERAVDNNELILVYQPIVAANVRAMPGVEALMRWSHPSLGILRPGQFIPQAEAFGMSDVLGDWALEHAITQIGVSPFDEPLWVNVNLSAAQIQDPHLPKKIQALLSKHKVAPARLGVEITESMSMLDVRTSSRVLRELQSMGISISLDDFGTGYSSLAQLHRLPIDTVKIDKTFIDHIEAGGHSVRIVEAILAMSNALGLRTVAEGVETSGQFKILKELGIGGLQGFGISYPRSWENLQEFVAEWKSGDAVQSCVAAQCPCKSPLQKIKA